MSLNRRSGGPAVGRSVIREAAGNLSCGVILRALQRPKDLRVASLGSTDPIVLSGQAVKSSVPLRSGRRFGGDSGSRQGRPEILRGLKAAQDDNSQQGVRRFAGPSRSENRSTSRRLAVSPSGFTLIELLVVIAVIAILAGLVAPQVFSNVGDARTTSARAQIENFGLALDGYRLDNHQYPGTAQGLAALMARPEGEPVPANWRGPYLRRALPTDPWGHPYIYRAPGDSVPNGYDLLSYGRDGKPGGAEEDQDITSWGGTTR